VQMLLVEEGLGLLKVFRLLSMRRLLENMIKDIH